MRPLLTALLLLLAPDSSPGADATSSPPAATLSIAMAGDSTMASVLKAPADRPNLAGWGQCLQACLPAHCRVTNLARSGASSKSFRDLGLWQRVLDCKAQWVIIQFGHNDQPGKGPARQTDASGSYRDNLRRFITEARAQGSKPILVTSVARRSFDSQGKLQDSLAPYAEATRIVAKETQVPLIDLHRMSLELFTQLGPQQSNRFGPADSDRTHFSREGAKEIAQLVSRQLLPILSAP
jgi:lysophospholipase L1-like esterase